MKARTGFVSNSSSSSFIIATKGEQDVKQIIIDAFKVDPKSPIYGLVTEAAEIMANGQSYNLEELLDEMGYTLSEFYESHPEFKGADRKGFTQYIYGSADDQSGVVAEEILVELDIHYADDKVIIEKEGGY